MMLEQDQVMAVQKLKGYWQEEFSTVWVATDHKGNAYLTYDFKLKQQGDKISNDFANTSWQPISDITYQRMKEVMHVSGQAATPLGEAKIYGRSYTENFETVRQFISERVNSDPHTHEALYQQQQNKLTDQTFKEEFQRYYRDSSVKTFFGNGARQQKLLEGTLQSLYYENYKFTTNEQFASRIVKSDGFKIVIRNEAKNLLSGTRSYSTEVAAKEAAMLREKNQSLFQENTTLRKINKELTMRVTNLVSHLKVKLGLSEAEIRTIEVTPVKSPPKSPGKQNGLDISM